jgi:EAL domain-containing protein (putative c-di-GMP-specific phosphodiesterase class I)
VRTIHLLNHARSFSEHELLFLNVHPRLLSSVKDHGRTFEQILHYYSVPTSRVVIEVKEFAAQESTVLAEAVNNYRSLGYKIAIDNFGASHSRINGVFNQARGSGGLMSARDYAELDRVLSLRPDIVKLDGALIRAAEQNDETISVIYTLVSAFHHIGTQVLIKGIETATQLKIARNMSADLLQGHLLNTPDFALEARGTLCRTQRLAA